MRIQVDNPHTLQKMIMQMLNTTFAQQQIIVSQTLFNCSLGVLRHCSYRIRLPTKRRLATQFLKYPRALYSQCYRR